jgi:insertion element IS1 protein InsB
VVIEKVDEAEMDEMWSFVEHKGQQRWLWHAIDHQSGAVLAYVLGSHQDAVFLQLQTLLAPFHISRFYTDDWGAYQRHLPAAQHEIGKENTQKIARKHLTLRTRIKRLARKTICFSKSIQMHDIVLGLFINRYAFGAIPQKSPCACSLERRPSLTQLSKLRLGLFKGATLQAEPLTMRSKALPFLRHIFGWSVTQAIEQLSGAIS